MRILLIIVLLITNSISNAQENPVKWSYGLKKTATNQYQLHILAKIEPGWHIYAQKQPKNAVAVPTRIDIQRLPDIRLVNTPAEVGKKEIYDLPSVGVTNHEYAGKVDFVQKIIIKPGTKEIKGTIHWQVCTHQKCLPEDSLTFVVPIKPQ